MEAWLWIVIALLWLIFAVKFAYLASRHWKLTGLSVKPIQHHGTVGWNTPAMSKIPNASGDATQTFLLVNDINRFVEDFNSRNYEVNKALVVGYLVAAGTALLSFVLALLQIFQIWNKLVSG